MEEKTDPIEKDLLKAYVTARRLRERLEAESAAAYKEMMAAQGLLVTFLEDLGKKSTGNYTELGSLLIKAPMPTFSVAPDHKEEIPAWVKEIGAGAVIKETIHHATLQSLFRERFDKGEPIPDYVEMKYVSQVSYSAPKK